MSRREAWHLAGNIVVVMCAVVITAMAVRREFFPAGRSEFRFRADAVHDTAWAEISSRGHQLGSSSGIVTIVEFGDFQCPACRDFARSALRGALAAFPQELQVLYRHWPLTYHEHAYAAALAAECAAAQGRFKEYHDLLYLKQDSIGVNSFESFAVESGVLDSTQFADCRADRETSDLVQADIDLVTTLAGTGTPTVLVDGNRLNGAPDSTKFHHLLSRAISAARKRR